MILHHGIYVLSWLTDFIYKIFLLSLTSERQTLWSRRPPSISLLCNIARIRNLPLYLPPISHPVKPTARILASLGPPSIPGELGRRAAAHTGLAVEDHLSVFGRARVAESIFELVLADVETVGLRSYRDVDGPGDFACILELAWFTGVCTMCKLGPVSI